MKITIQQLLDSTEALQRLIAIPLNSALKFRLARVVKQVQSEMGAFHETRTELCEKYGTIREDRTAYDFTPENQLLFADEYAALARELVELRFDSFSEATFEKIEINTQDVINLGWLFGELGSADIVPVSDATEGVDHASS